MTNWASFVDAHPNVQVSHRILVVEPDALVAQSVASSLVSHAYVVEVVPNAEQAVLALQHFQPDVAMLDIDRHEIAGFEVARVLRQERPGRHRILLLALVGAADSVWRDAAHAAGFDVVVVKPVNSQFLVDLLEGLLRTQGADAKDGDALDRVLDADR